MKREAENPGLKVNEIILFGSRARDDFRKDSDRMFWWFFRSLCQGKPGLKRTNLSNGELLFKGVRADILFISKGELEKVKEDRGFVYHYALKEGLRV